MNRKLSLRLNGKVRVCALLGSLLLSGCFFGSKDTELQQWMVEQRGNTPAKVVPITAPKKFVPQAYTQQAAMEPFNNQKLLQALRKDSSQSAANLALISPELGRRKEVLESFPLDAVSMVGTLNKTNTPVALLKVDKLLYQVKVGNYVGQNYGRITKISDTEIALREIAQDASGEWIERKVNLQLQAKEK
jgi:type IV pilus assembly protein PilP